jgi:hypothetical protein
MAGIEVNDSEGPYPYAWIRFRDDPAAPFASMFGDGKTFTPNVDLTDEEEAELKDLRARWKAWQDRLLAAAGAG